MLGVWLVLRMHTSCQILLCIDVAATSAKSAKMSQQLLKQVLYLFSMDFTQVNFFPLDIQN